MRVSSADATWLSLAAPAEPLGCLFLLVTVADVIVRRCAVEAACSPAAPPESGGPIRTGKDRYARVSRLARCRCQRRGRPA